MSSEKQKRELELLKQTLAEKNLEISQWEEGFNKLENDYLKV
jgi:hypothetical protein